MIRTSIEDTPDRVASRREFSDYDHLTAMRVAALISAPP
jgi:hypothetical protein